MKPIVIIIALTTTVHAGGEERGNGRDKTRGGYAYSRETHTDSHSRESDKWTQDTRPHAVPEPSSPLAMLVSAAMALVTRRKRGRGKWVREKRVDLRTVRIL